MRNESASIVTPAAALNPTHKLSSGDKQIDLFLEGGLPYGAITEWGVPLGRGGRTIILKFLEYATNTLESSFFVLWVYPETKYSIFPPAFAAHGIALTRIRFVASNTPLSQLKPIFLEPIFKVIVLDDVQLSQDDLCFIGQKARSHQQVICLLRNYFLSESRGNVWTKLRINAWYENFPDKHYTLKVIRGLSPRQCYLAATGVIKND